MTVLLFGDTVTSTNLFHAIPTPIVDPFLYVETGGRRVAVIGSLDANNVQAAAPGVETVDPERYGKRELSSLPRLEARAEGVRRALADLGVEAAVVPWDFPLSLADALRGHGIELTVDDDVFTDRRRIKTESQLAGIRRAQKAADAAMAVARQAIHSGHEGLTCEEVRRDMQLVARKHGCELDDDVVVAPGAQGAVGHEPGTGPIEIGESVIVDIWPRDPASRCWADMTRTFVAGGGEPDDELREYWELTREALARVTEAVRPGVNGRELYDIACAVYEAAGRPTNRTAEPGSAEGFFHGLGHGVGLDVHELPRMGLAGDDLVAGDVVTVEPGCYRQGYGGVRLEDLLLVTPDGCEVITRFPYDL